MTRIKVLAATAAVAAAVVSALVAAPAGATPGPGCVSKREFNSQFSGTRARLERDWGVRGQGRRVGPTDPMPAYYRENMKPGSIVVKYRLCGYSLGRGAAYVYYDRQPKRPAYLASLWTGQVPMVPANVFPLVTRS